MSGDVHVRICEHLGGRFPGVTRLIITGYSKEWLEEEVMPIVIRFLAERGLTLSPEKTRITHITEGLDFVRRESRIDELFFEPAVPSSAPTGTCKMSNHPV